ncbi:MULTISPECIES: stage II sporulation protein P [Bacillaceae]|uniref:stage II sporulation protein P n=1 Tax=Bacillaceae TaxID=186817 RepID=UPI001E3C0DE7|nr:MULTISPECIES: stage II sporulation protein P [Bacillaceae]MCK1981992.1 stage II sporulation protein P [Peribacillus sp. Aquil_B1]MCK2007656.1 stage II sporulation protein P [Peribacillus sp. Aquil_B8]
MNNRKRYITTPIRCMAMVLVGMILTFSLVAFLVTSPLNFTSRTVNGIIGNSAIDQVLILALNSENHYFYQKQSMNSPSLMKLSFESMTNFKINDTRTLLGRELPGLSIYNTEIAVAGKGTNITNLPVESGPPLDIYLKDREIAEENLKQPEEDGKHEDAINPKEKSVYIYHSHSWEAFLPFIKGATTPNEAVSSDQRANVIAVGDLLSHELINKGIGVEHNTENMAANLKSQKLDYRSSYNLTRKDVQEAMGSNDKLKILIDIHRDSQRKAVTTTTIQGKEYARLFFIVGKEHKNYEKNLEYAKEINKKFEEKYPGLSRGVFIKGKDEGNGIYNQDISDKALLVEFGGVDNNLTELSNTIKAFAEVFSDKYWEAEEVNG